MCRGLRLAAFPAPLPGVSSFLACLPLPAGILCLLCVLLVFCRIRSIQLICNAGTPCHYMLPLLHSRLRLRIFLLSQKSYMPASLPVRFCSAGRSSLFLFFLPCPCTQALCLFLLCLSFLLILRYLDGYGM